MCGVIGRGNGGPYVTRIEEFSITSFRLRFRSAFLNGITFIVAHFYGTD